ncbi:protein methyltransferase [Archaeoglobales archaeon]|nr:MAG: protein methyltransferase [Archaeoglobales archaeon]
MEVYPIAEDTELLLDASLKEVKKKDIVLELGCGSGYVAKKISEKCRLVVASDINPYAVKKAKELGLNVVRADLLRAFKRKFSLVLFNPPYLELEEFEKRGDWMEKAIDGGKKGLEIIKRFIDELDGVLTEEGRAILVHSSFNLPEIYDLLEGKGYKFELLEEKKLFFEKLYAIKIFRHYE